MSLGEHLEELRRRIIYALAGLTAGTAICLYFAPVIIDVLKEPYVEVMKGLGLKGDLAVLDVTAGLTNYLKVSVYAGIVLASPWIVYQLWMFVSAGLHQKEKRYVLLVVPFCALLFVGGVAFFLLVVAESVLRFLLELSKWLGMVPMITFENHIGFMTRLMVVFGLAFQTPLVILTLAATNLVSLKMLHRYRRHVIVVILIVAALSTPPDPFSQLALAIPIWLLYELGVVLVYLLKRKEKSPQS